MTKSANQVTFSHMVLFVKNIETAKQFYTTMLDQTIDLDFGTNISFNGGLALWEIRPEYPIAKTLGNRLNLNATDNRTELYFETEDIDSMLDRLKKNNITFLHELVNEPWGQQTMRFFDPDNHLIEIGESMASFIGRFYKQGLTVKQIAERTGVQLEVVEKILAP